MVLRNAVRYLLGCVPGCLSGFLFITYPETMPARIPVFSQPTTLAICGGECVYAQELEIPKEILEQK